jgi:hypothetical protein
LSEEAKDYSRKAFHCVVQEMQHTSTSHPAFKEMTADQWSLSIHLIPNVLSGGKLDIEKIEEATQKRFSLVLCQIIYA